MVSTNISMHMLFGLLYTYKTNFECTFSVKRNTHRIMCTETQIPTISAIFFK